MLRTSTIKPCRCGGSTEISSGRCFGGVNIRSRQRNARLTVVSWSGAGWRGSSSSSRDDIPKVEPAFVIPPPSKGSQYGTHSSVSGSYDGGVFGGTSGFGGSGGGAANFFSAGGSFGRDGRPNVSLMMRLRLMMLSMGWACSMYLLVSSIVKVGRWGAQQLGYIPMSMHNLSTHGAVDAASGTAIEDAGSESEEGGHATPHVLAIKASTASTTAAAVTPTAMAACDTVITQASASSQLSQAAVSVTAATPLEGSEAATGAAATGGASSQAAASSTQPHTGGATDMDDEQRAYLHMLKRHEQFKAGAGVHMGSEEGAVVAVSWPQATTAYAMVMGTLAFFFVVQ